MLGVELRLLDEKFIEAGGLQIVRTAEIGGEFFGGDVVDDNFRSLCVFETTNEKLEAPPGGFERLKIGVVEHLEHGIAQSACSR